MRILLVEDEIELAKNTAKFLREHDFDVDLAESVSIAWASLREIDYSIVLLDRRLPDGDGLSLIVKAQSMTKLPRFLVLSALGDVDDRVAGLDSGAGDYIVKPFEPKELLARIRAMLRIPRSSNQARAEIGGLEYDRAGRLFRVNGKIFDLRRREFVILELLVTKPEQIVRRSEIIDRVYGFDEPPLSNALESHVSRIRKRLKETDAGLYIKTARGLGYMLTEDTDG